MSPWLRLACLFLAACEPVLLVADEDTRQSASSAMPDASRNGAEVRDDTVTGEPSVQAGSSAPAPSDNTGAAPVVQLSLTSFACGTCFDLIAHGSGGVPPYKYAWEDGSHSDTRRVCAPADGREVWVVVEDATGARSNAYITRLHADESAAAACASDNVAAANDPQAMMCLMNLSFEGMPAINTGADFDATPWSSCIDPSAALSGVANTPDIANDSLEPMIGVAPAPRDGVTYLTMSAGEQTSQALCEPLQAGTQTSFRLDAMRLDLGAPDMFFLQIWGGSAADCSQRQLLWTSPALETTWQTYCVTLQPGQSMDQITLRAVVQAPQFVVSYMAVDHLVPVSACP